MKDDIDWFPAVIACICFACFGVLYVRDALALGNIFAGIGLGILITWGHYEA